MLKLMLFGVLIMSILLFGCVSSDGENKTVPSVSSDGENKTVPSVSSDGENKTVPSVDLSDIEVSDLSGYWRYFDVNITSFNQTDIIKYTLTLSKYGDRDVNETPRNGWKFVVLWIEVHNSDRESHWFRTNSDDLYKPLKIEVEDGRWFDQIKFDCIYTPDTECMLGCMSGSYGKCEVYASSQKIEPGFGTEAMLVFEIPENTTAIALMYTTGSPNLRYNLTNR